MIPIRSFTACNQTDLKLYYNEQNDPLRCQFCQSKNKESLLYDLILSDGLTHWYVCPRYGFAGTGTEYLARVSDTEIGQQIQLLMTQRIIPPVEAEEIQKFRQFREARKRLKEQFSSAAPFRHNTTIAFADMYDLDYYPPASSFRQGEKIEFERWFKPSLKDKRKCTSHSRLFHGPWSKITAIPLYDLPCHFSGILFVNGHEQESPKYVLRRLGPMTGGQFLFDPGFWGTRALCRPDQTAVVMSTQWKLALSLQAARRQTPIHDIYQYLESIAEPNHAHVQQNLCSPILWKQTATRFQGTVRRRFDKQTIQLVILLYFSFPNLLYC